jgi:FlaA1/EpsC-like NDP-sugar epimerase
MTSSSDEKSIDSPLDRPLLAALDFASILLFALVGTASHATAGVDILAVFAVAVPFLISWFIITPFLGLYNDKATSDKMSAFLNASRGWIVAIPLGFVLRGIIKGYIPPIPFVVVTMIATLTIIGGTRVAYTAVNEKLAS